MSELGLGTPDTRASHRYVRRRRGHGALATFIALALVVALLGGLAYVGRNALANLLPSGGVDDFPGPGTGSVVVQVASGDTVTAIGGTLESAGVIASREAFLDAASENADATSIQPGSYELRAEMSAAGALALLVDPANRLVSTVALPEGLRLGESLARLAEGTKIPLADLEAALAAPDALGLPAYAASAEGFLFPATYDFEPAATASDVLSATIARFAQAAVTVDLESRAAALGITPLQAVTVASIIEDETSRAEDMPKVARVLYNRLAIDMRLQLDSTVSYAVGSTGTVFTTEAERQVDSPYNTYRYAGLPPGPISSPGEAAMEAALSPAAGSWLFFVAVDLETGETLFADTKEQHDVNVARLRAYCQTSDTC